MAEVEVSTIQKTVRAEWDHGDFGHKQTYHRPDTWVTVGSDTFIEDMEVITNNFLKWELDLLFSLLKEKKTWESPL